MLLPHQLPHRPPVAAVPRRAFFLRPVLNGRDRWVLRGFLCCWLASMVSFWSWWLSSPHWATAFGMALSSILILMVLALPVWLFFAVSRLTVPRLESFPSSGPPAPSRVAFVFTKTPSEPWEMVRRSVEGALRQEGVGPFDVWLADEAPTEPVVSWCDSNGVRIVSRQGISSYHRRHWPRRTRSKEGNLAYFYDLVGYDNYDVVCQFDADHVPEADYLRHVLAAFMDPRVGYVAAPSICGRNADRSWAARGRLYREATLHGPVQAGQNDGYAPTCIGSHYAVRTVALREIGGVGPELAEDFSTSFLMHAHGWKGVFALDAIANGDGPDTVADAMTQELQWSRSLTLFLLRYSRPHWGNFQPGERFKFAYAQLWYPMFALQMVLGFVFPIIALVTGIPWVTVNLLQYLLYASTPGLVLVALVLWLRSKQVLRPVDAPVISWEAWLFQLARWPWVVIGVAQAVLGQLLRREFGFKVTPKGSGRQPLPAAAISPYLGLSAVSSIVAGTLPTSTADGYRILVLGNAITYAVVAIAVAALHRRENGRVPGVVTGLVAGAVALTAAVTVLATHPQTLGLIFSGPAVRQAVTEGVGPYLYLAALALVLTVRWRTANRPSPVAAVGSAPAMAVLSPAAAVPSEDWWDRALASAVLAQHTRDLANELAHAGGRDSARLSSR